MRGKPTMKLKHVRKAILPKRKTEEEENKLEKDRDGLLPKWSLFIDEYFKNGFNGTRAYRKVYDVKSDKIARSSATRLLSYESVNDEVQYRLEAQKVTNDAIVAELWDIGKNYRGEKTLGPAQQALKTLAQTKGMLTDVTKHQFDIDNPAVFVGALSQKEEDDFKKNSKRIEE